MLNSTGEFWEPVKNSHLTRRVSGSWGTPAPKSLQVRAAPWMLFRGSRSLSAVLEARQASGEEAQGMLRARVGPAPLLKDR